MKDNVDNLGWTWRRLLHQFDKYLEYLILPNQPRDATSLMHKNQRGKCRYVMKVHLEEIHIGLSRAYV